jgi:hypothetical protein
LVLFELRRYHRYCKRGISPSKARKRAQTRAEDLMASDDKFFYFHNGKKT